MKILFLLITVFISVAPQAAYAHLVSTRFGELYSGMLHPITSLQHLVPWIAMGLLAGLQTPTTARRAIMFFPLGVFLGLTLADAIPALTFFDSLNIASMVIIGLLVAFNFPINKSVFIILVSLFGMSHGYANASQELYGVQWVLYIMGVMLSAYLLITLVSAGSCTINAYRAWGGIALRSIGSWIVAAGTMYSGFLLLAK